MLKGSIPTIGSIQRTNAVLVVLSAAILGWLASRSAAVGCILGGAAVIANLWILSALGGLILSAAGAGISGVAAKLGVLALPLKLLIVAGLVYLVLSHARVDAMGFGVGVLTQMAAIIIQTTRASFRSAP